MGCRENTHQLQGNSQKPAAGKKCKTNCPTRLSAHLHVCVQNSTLLRVKRLSEFTSYHVINHGSMHENASAF